MIISFKKMGICSILVIFASAMVILGLKTLTYSEVFNPMEVETTYGPIKLTMRLDKTTYRLGEPVNITLIVMNISNETVLLGFSAPCKTNFVVCNKSSQTIFDYFLSVGWADTGVDVVLDPGEALSQTLTWDQLEIDNLPPFASRQVQLGTYYIKGQVGPLLFYVGSPEEYNPLEYANFIKIETPEVKMEII